MYLWIRSQDKTELVKSSRIKITENFETKDGITTNDYTIYNFDGVHINHLGKYKTKERALEVLDEIQRLLTPQIITLTDNIKKNNKDAELTNVFGIVKSGQVIDIKELSTVVYEMPKD